MAAVEPTNSRLKVSRAGRQISGKIPKPVVLIDTREQAPFDFGEFGNWVGGQQLATLKTADYTVLGMEDILCLERKSLADMVGTLAQPENRKRFLRECDRMLDFKHRAIIIEASYEDIKSPYRFASQVQAHPNGISGSLDAIEAKYGIHIIYTSQNKFLATERAASYLSKHFTYWWLEKSNMGRVLNEGDL